MIVGPLLDIQRYSVKLPSDLYPYKGKQVIQVRHDSTIPDGDSGWRPMIALCGDFFHPAFEQRNALNIPGPFYGAETDNCGTGPLQAPNNVLMDRSGREFISRQPSDEEQLRDVISAALCECCCGYGADGDDHWSLSLIREWWRDRRDLLSESAGLDGSPHAILAWRRFLAGEGESYLRSYAYLLEERRIPPEASVLPEVR